MQTNPEMFLVFFSGQRADPSPEPQMVRPYREKRELWLYVYCTVYTIEHNASLFVFSNNFLHFRYLYF